MRARRGWVIGSAVMGLFAILFVVLAGSAAALILAAIGGIAGALLGVPLLGGAARKDAQGRPPGTERMVLVPVAVVLGMFLVPRLFDVIGLSLGWGLTAGAFAFIAMATYVTSRSDEIFGHTR